MSLQIAVRLPDEQVAQLDWIVTTLGLDSRAEAVRAAIDDLAGQLRRKAVDHRYLDAYARQPETVAEVAHARRAGIASIGQEPWDPWW